MEGLPISEIASILGITSSAAKARLFRRGIKPYRIIGTTGLYTESDMEAIRDAGIGRQLNKSKTSTDTMPKNDSNKE